MINKQLDIFYTKKLINKQLDVLYISKTGDGIDEAIDMMINIVEKHEVPDVVYKSDEAPTPIPKSI